MSSEPVRKILPLPRIGPPWYTPQLRRDLLKRVQKAFGLPPTGLYDEKLVQKVSEAQGQLGLPVTGIVDNILLEMLGFSVVAGDVGWPETLQPEQGAQPPAGQEGQEGQQPLQGPVG